MPAGLKMLKAFQILLTETAVLGMCSPGFWQEAMCAPTQLRMERGMLCTAKSMLGATAL